MVFQILTSQKSLCGIVPSCFNIWHTTYIHHTQGYISLLHRRGHHFGGKKPGSALGQPVTSGRLLLKDLLTSVQIGSQHEMHGLELSCSGVLQ